MLFSMSLLLYHSQKFKFEILRQRYHFFSERTDNSRKKSLEIKIKQTSPKQQSDITGATRGQLPEFAFFPETSYILLRLRCYWRNHQTVFYMFLSNNYFSGLTGTGRTTPTKSKPTPTTRRNLLSSQSFRIYFYGYAAIGVKH
jgi:hypothetical protein